MTIMPGNDRRKSNRRQNHRREANLESIKIGGDVGKGGEVTVHYGTVLQRKEKTTFSWFDEFTVEWSETFLTRNKNDKKGE